MSQKKWHHHSAAERQVAFTYLKEGKTVKQTAQLCDVHPSTIKAWNRTRILRGADYDKKTKPRYRKYSDDLKLAAVSMYLKGKDATEVAKLFDILYPGTVTTWANDARYRGGITLEEEKRPFKNNDKRKPLKPLEEMTPEEELAFLRMENAILKKFHSLRLAQQQPKKK